MKFKNLNRYRVGGTNAKMDLAIPLPKTPSGRAYRYSPNPDAHPRHFVIGKAEDNFEISDTARARMKLTPRSPQTVCPYSGQIAEDGAFIHPDDEKAAIKTVEHAVLQDVEAMVHDMFKDFGRSVRGSKFISVKTSTPRKRPRPHFARSDLLRELVCDHCGRDYGVFAIALFCPDCGAPNVRLHFERERLLVGAQVDLAEAQDEQLAELAYRLLGNAHEDVLTAFEATQKTVYLFGKAQASGGVAPKPVGNDFQNLEKAQKRFAELQLDPFHSLTEAELATLRLNIQKRHVIGHNLGVVDAKFAQHADEARVGETVELVAGDIKEFAAICQKVVDDLDAWLVGAPSPTIGRQFAPLLDAADAATEVAPLTLDALQVQSGPLAREIALLLAKDSETGYPALARATGEMLVAAFPESSPRELNKAIAELESESFITSRSALGLQIPMISATVDLFAIFDPVAVGTSPYADACALIDHILAAPRHSESGSFSICAQTLREEINWPLRRFNPALGLVVAEIDERRVSKAMGSEFVAYSFIVSAADEIELERLAARLRGRR